MEAKVVSRFQSVFLCWIPIINLIILVILLIDRRKIHAVLWLIITAVVMTVFGLIESNLTNKYYKDNFNLDSAQQVVKTKTKDISREFPQYNFKSVTRVFPDQFFRDGIYELPIDNGEGESMTAKVVIESRQVKSYMVYDKNKKLVEDKFDAILDEQIKSFEQQNPGKKIIYGDLKPKLSLPLYLNFFIASYLVSIFFVFYLMWTKAPQWIGKPNLSGKPRSYEKPAQSKKGFLFGVGKTRPQEFVPSKVLAKYIAKFPEESFQEFAEAKNAKIVANKD